MADIAPDDEEGGYDNVLFMCEDCNEEYYLPEDTDMCPFCESSDIEAAQ